MPGLSAVAPTAILKDALRDFEGAEQQGTSSFIPSAQWAGPRTGYYFGKGSQGLGYYRDGDANDPAFANGAEADDDEAGPSSSHRPHLDPEELLREAERAAGTVDLETVDARAVKRLVAALVKKASQNMEQRARHADQPERFLESEVELDESVNALRVVSAAPDLYPILLETNAVPSVVPLLAHENADIAGDVMELLAELVGEDAVEEAAEPVGALVAALVDAGLLPALAQRLPTFDERVPEEAAAVRSALGVLQALVEVDPKLAAQVLGGDEEGENGKAADTTTSAISSWLLKRLAAKGEADETRALAAELLGTLAQSGPEARKILVRDGIVEALLQAIAPYRAKDAEDGDESEYVESLFAALCAVLIEPEAREDFVAAEGVELMVIMLRAKRAGRAAALRALDFATTNCRLAAERFVERGGLGPLFAAFMGKGKGRRSAEQREEEEERSVSIGSTLLQLLGPQPSALQSRVAAKFVESEFEKVDRLIEIFFRYEKRVNSSEERLLRAEDADPDEILLARMEGGLFTLQQAAVIAGTLWELGDVGLRKRVLMLLHQHAHTLGTLRDVLLGRLEALGDDGEHVAEQRAHLQSLLKSLGWKTPEDRDFPTESEPDKQREGLDVPEIEGGADATTTANDRRKRDHASSDEDDRRSERRYRRGCSRTPER